MCLGPLCLWMAFLGSLFYFSINLFAGSQLRTPVIREEIAPVQEDCQEEELFHPKAQESTPKAGWKRPAWAEEVAQLKKWFQDRNEPLTLPPCVSRQSSSFGDPFSLTLVEYMQLAEEKLKYLEESQTPDWKSIKNISLKRSEIMARQARQWFFTKGSHQLQDILGDHLKRQQFRTLLFCIEKERATLTQRAWEAEQKNQALSPAVIQQGLGRHPEPFNDILVTGSGIYLKKMIGKGSFKTVSSMLDLRTGESFVPIAFHQRQPAAQHEFVINQKVAQISSGTGLVQAWPGSKSTLQSLWPKTMEKQKGLLVFPHYEGEALDIFPTLARCDQLRALQQWTQGLVTLQEQGIAHRDLKPENLFLSSPRASEGAPKAGIGDFGGAVDLIDLDTAQQRREALIYGTHTPGYLDLAVIQDGISKKEKSLTKEEWKKLLFKRDTYAMAMSFFWLTQEYPSRLFPILNQVFHFDPQLFLSGDQAAKAQVDQLLKAFQDSFSELLANPRLTSLQKWILQGLNPNVEERPTPVEWNRSLNRALTLESLPIENCFLILR